MIEILAQSLPGESRADRAKCRKLATSLECRLADGSPGGYFSRSYSSEAVFCGYSANRQFGIDCEKTHADHEVAGMGKFMRELCEWRNLKSPGRILRAWTLVEACAKLTGCGITAKIREIEFPDSLCRSGRLIWQKREIFWKSLPFYGHWLTVAWFDDANPAISIRLIRQLCNAL